MIQPYVQDAVDTAIDGLDIEPKVVEVLDKLDGQEDNVIDIKGGKSSN